jgi:hypothetical protein
MQCAVPFAGDTPEQAIKDLEDTVYFIFDIYTEEGSTLDPLPASHKPDDLENPAVHCVRSLTVSVPKR